VRTHLRPLRFLFAAAALAWLAPARAGELTCWFPPKFSAEKAKAIAEALSTSGVKVTPQVAGNYPEILSAFSSKGEHLVYVGSFVQAILSVKGQGVALAQAVDGKESYGAWMVFPKGADPAAILKDSPAQIAFAKGASSGESGAKAATDGKAAVARASHDAAVEAVKSGKAKAAFVKSWWWEANKGKHPELEAHQVAGVSDSRNPDNVLTASKSVDAAVRAKLKAAALAAPGAFGAKSMQPFDGDFSFTIGLMKKGHIDPAGYLFE
jgi:ABC-type phosphate/phosphonate transport system substrate-binding protein